MMNRYRLLDIATAAEPSPRPARYEVPFSVAQNFIDHARFFKEETIQVGPCKIWNFNTPNRGFGNIIVVEGENELVVGPIMALRAGYMYGVALPAFAEGMHLHTACCGFNVLGSNGHV